MSAEGRLIHILKVRKPTLFVFLLPALVIYLLIYAIPIVTVFVTSFFDYTILEFSYVGLENYAQFFGEGLRARHFSQAVDNTLIWVLLQGTVHVFIGVAVALMLNRRPKGWRVVRTAYMLPNIMSAAALGLIYWNVFNVERGVLNGIIRLFNEDFAMNWFIQHPFLTVTYTWLFFAGLITILALGEMMSISPEIYEAARVDGASKLQVDIYVVLPMIRVTIGTCVVLAVTSMLRQFELIFLTTSGGPGVATLNLPLLIYRTALLENNFGMANAYGAFTIVLGVILVLIINRVISRVEYE